MREGTERLVGRAIGCAVVGAVGLLILLVVGLLALAFPLTLSIVAGALVVLGIVEWRRRNRRPAQSLLDADRAKPGEGTQRPQLQARDIRR